MKLVKGKRNVQNRRHTVEIEAQIGTHRDEGNRCNLVPKAIALLMTLYSHGYYKRTQQWINTALFLSHNYITKDDSIFSK